jgi:hypothetical protein
VPHVDSLNPADPEPGGLDEATGGKRLFTAMVSPCSSYPPGPPLQVYLSSLTLLLQVYLSSLAPGGGGRTVFPLLGLSVPPARGDLLLWHTVSGHRLPLDDQQQQ